MSAFSIIIFGIVSYMLFINNNCSATIISSVQIKNGSLVRSHWHGVSSLTRERFNISGIISSESETNFLRLSKVDCLGLGSAIASTLHWFFVGSCKDCDNLNVKFYLSSRRQRHRVEVLVGRQFGLEWTDFQINRRTVLIVHGFLSHGNEMWIKTMEDAFLLWGDVNVIVVDWSAGGNSWNYYKAVVNTRIVGDKITRFLGQIVNTTLASGNIHPSQWGPLHLVGHSLGAHICGFVCHNFNPVQKNWLIQRVTGLDPAQPCFTTKDPAMKLDRTDAPFVDIIHTNGRLLSHLGLGLPTPIGHVDFYPNGGMKQPGCDSMMGSSFFNFLPISNSKIQETICSHGRSYAYLIESLFSAVTNNCTFWAHPWDMTYRGALKVLRQTCGPNNCTEMGIRAEDYSQRGIFYVATAEHPPFCVGDTAINQNQLIYLAEDLAGQLED
ncbi:pancreatic triacylglycerol lipase-like [Neodiprion virginianus]|uniref:pancreatic triacylglycerol lipase-like n=1 Tax=Neodiprion virginianus TaxID=2961670 RepID=UPI001EE6E2D8|nr:pancreatic triacylglycerol lipase-like [Neodiprion virginianus]